MYLHHLKDTDKEMPVDWDFPDTWEKFNKSESPFLFVRGVGEEFTGSDEKVIFIIKEGYELREGLVYAVFEDCHVDIVPGDKAKKYRQGKTAEAEAAEEKE